MQKISMFSGNQPLSAQLFSPIISNGQGILFIHGWRSNQESPRQMATALAERGFTCLTFDLRGMGQSAGNADVLTRQEYLQDCLAAYDKLAILPGISAFHAVGSSFGSYLATLLSIERTLSGLVLRVPANYIDDGFATAAQSLISDRIDAQDPAVQPINYGKTAAIRALNQFEGRVLIVESGSDDIVRPSTVHGYRSAITDQSRLKYVVMEGAPHSITMQPKFLNQYQAILLDWFANETTEP